MLAEIRKSKVVFYNTVVAQAQKVECSGDRMTFTFSPSQRALCDMLEQSRSWLEPMAQQIAGRKIIVAGFSQEPAPGSAAQSTQPERAAAADKKSALRERALADAGVQALLEVFPAEIRDVEEM